MNNLVITFKKNGVVKTFIPNDVVVLSNQMSIHFEDVDNDNTFILLSICVALQLHFERIDNDIYVCVPNECIIEIKF